MSTKLPLDEMTVAEKLQLMEELWADLSQQPEQVPTPDWHGEILSQRMAEVRNGTVEFVDWEDAKRRLRDRLQ